jgi:hypothetical protein
LPYNGGSPLDRLTSVDGLGAPAGGCPLALRFRSHGDSTYGKKLCDGAANRFRLRNAIPLLEHFQADGDLVVNEERVTLSWAHVSTQWYGNVHTLVKRLFLWFKERMLAVTGFDMNNPPANMQPPELLSHYETASVGV